MKSIWINPNLKNELAILKYKLNLKNISDVVDILMEKEDEVNNGK